MASINSARRQGPKAGDSPLSLAISSQTPEVDFIDNRLSQYHPEFSVPGVAYDLQRNRYLANTSFMEQNGADNTLETAPRPVPSSVDKMKFWATIFPLAMVSLEAQYPVEPRGRVESGYSIRNTSSWGQVETQLQRAREAYENTAGFTGNFKKGTRKVVDYAPKMSGAVSLVPDIDTASAVVSVVKTLLTVSYAFAFHLSCCVHLC